jgi:hypothetical protein
MPFQTSVATVPAPAVPGDWASSNVRMFVPAGPGGLVTGAAGLTIGRFAWLQPSPLDPNETPMIVNNFGNGQPAGFVHREQQGLLTIYLAETSFLIPPGFGVTLISGGDVWVKNDGTTEALYDQFAYANYADGRISFAAAAAGATASATGSIAASTGSFTGSIAGNVMTITAVGSGVVVPGGTLSGTAVATGTMVVAQLTGTAGGIGTYSVSIPDQVVASTTISETYGTFTAASALVGLFGAGDVLSGASVVAGTYISALGTGTGGLGTYIVSNNTVVSSTTITAALSYQTKWRARSQGPAGGLIKMSTHTLG